MSPHVFMIYDQVFALPDATHACFFLCFLLWQVLFVFETLCCSVFRLTKSTLVTYDDYCDISVPLLASTLHNAQTSPNAMCQSDRSKCQQYAANTPLVWPGCTATPTLLFLAKRMLSSYQPLNPKCGW